MKPIFNAKEILSAAPDALSMALGVSMPNSHPLASHISLADIAYAAGSSKNGYDPSSPRSKVMAAGLSSGDFSVMLAASAQHLVAKTYSSQGQHSAFTVPISAKSYQSMGVASLDFDPGLEILSDRAEISRGYALVAEGPVSANVTTFGKIIELSREAIFNNDLRGFGVLVANLGSSAARIEARMVAEALDLNPAMRDGATIFDLSGNDVHNNVVASEFSGPALGQAMQKLRTQKTASGYLADLASKHLIVSPDLEFTARSIIVDFGLNIQVCVLAYLTPGRWFLLGDPALIPVVGLLTLDGEPTVLRIKAEKKRSFNNDGAALRVLADLGVTVMSRTGIVRGGVL